MSCLPEQLYSVYVDGELELEQVREVESHLIQCQRCRARILALEDESELLSDLVLQRDPATTPPVPARERARGLALGLAPTLALGVLVVGVGGWVVEQRLPGMSWWDPRKLIGAYDMAFDTIFMARDALPVVFDLALAVGATVGMAAVLTFLMGAFLRRVTGTAAVLLLAFVPLMAAQPGWALDVRWDERRVEIAADEVLDDTLVASAETIEIAGTVRGDVVALAERVTIRGRVEGNVFAMAREVLVEGSVEGSLHMACERCDLEGSVSGNLYAAAEDATLAKDGRVERDAHLFANGVRVDGSTGRDLSAFAEWVEIRGEVGRTARTFGERSSVLGDARIGGDLLIEVMKKDDSEIASTATIGGEVRETEIEHHKAPGASKWLDGGFYLSSLIFIASAFLVGLLLHAVFPVLFSGTVRTGGEFGRCLGYGLVALVLTPLVLGLLAISIVGIPVAVLGLFVYVTVLFCSTIVVSSLVGGSILGSDPEAEKGFGVALLLGLVLVVIATHIPFVGGVLRVLVWLVGMGLLVTTAFELWQERRREYA